MKVLDARENRPLDGGASFTVGNRLFRVAWTIAWFVAARFTPPPLHRWRRMILRLFGANVARGARVHASVRIWHPGNLTVGESALIGPGAIIYNQGHVTIGDRTVISQRAHLCASSHDVRDPAFQLILRPVVIGSSCWIAAEAFVGPGVAMADGSVLAARGALFEDAQADTIYRGNPAAAIRNRW
ncbi:putative colanic acid biosynthesis acetyltransferase [Croceicoccus sp. BE223]|uniref:putative colanic acid biosynthesis acetyltransferase n=1 Tax=Croceicoccus sp. BE223 TaxID=2817716 RepID=UPI002856DF14|nr:putative colanic acid biosynthesis acetyltransferase [Croceicoccus sp. BE223]MDR7102061.1 putative colanic acid biosynthesis acetyltransferase WcaF [Croceicoccus sp. BE223]